MELVEQVLGNIHNEIWRNRLEHARIDVLELDQWDAQKNRLRKQSAGGVVLAVSLDRDRFLRDGDILKWDEASNEAVVARIHLCEVMVISLLPLALRPAAEIMETSVKLGHALGNQHWPAVIKGHNVYVPMTVARKVMESVMETHRLKDISYSFMEGDQALALLEPQEARRLFGGTEMPADGHSPGHSHTHGETGEHKHDPRPHIPHRPEQDHASTARSRSGK